MCLDCPSLAAKDSGLLWCRHQEFKSSPLLQHVLCGKITTIYGVLTIFGYWLTTSTGVMYCKNIKTGSSPVNHKPFLVTVWKVFTLKMRAFWIILSSLFLIHSEGFCVEEWTSCTERSEFYVSSLTGHDSEECLVPNNFSNPCASFKYVVFHALGSCFDYVLLDSSVQLDEVLVFNYTEIGIVGNHTPAVTVFCQNNSGLVYTSGDVYLKHLAFSGCSLKVFDYVNNSKWYPAVMSLYSSILFQQLQTIKILNCSFSEHAGSALTLLDVAGTIDIESCNFNGEESMLNSAQPRSGGIVLHSSIHNTANDVNISIKYCNFRSNINMGLGGECENASSIAPGSIGRGGALDAMLETNAVSFVLKIVECFFERNRAMKGGALSIYYMGTKSNFNISLIHSNFTSNSACLDGGAIVFSSDEDVMSENDGCYDSLAFFTMTSCHLKYNTAKTGGALAAYIKGCSSCDSLMNLFMTDSHWLMNNATAAGFALWLGSVDMDCYWAHTRFRIESQCFNCEFISNSGAGGGYDSVGAVVVDSAKISFFAITYFDYNLNSALALRTNSVANFSNETTFKSNEGVVGGAIQLQGNSSLHICANAKIIFKNNSAIVAGGAVHSMTTKNMHCIFDFEDAAKAKQIFFINNTVPGRKQSIFVEYSETCEMLESSVKLSFDLSSYSQVMFPPMFVKLALVKPENIEYYQDLHQTFKVSLGEKLKLIPISVSDRFSRPLLNWTGYIWIKPTKSDSFLLKGPNTITFDSSTDSNSFQIEGIEVYNDTLVPFNVEFYYLGESGYNVGTTVLNITIIPCKLGFKFLNGTCQCVSAEHIQCVPDNSMVCVSKHYWYGSNLDSPLPCPVSNCNYMSGECSVQTQLHQNSSFFCCMNNSNDLCIGGRGNVLCSECVHNNSFTFGALQCVDTSKSCGDFYTLLLFLALLVYWIAWSVGLHVLLSVNLTVGSGGMYGIVYYFSIVTIYTNHTPLFGVWWLRIPIYISTMVTQLDPELLGYAEVCFIESWTNPLNHLFFTYTTPLFIVFFIIQLVLVVRYCKCLRQCGSVFTYSSSHVISMLILLSHSLLSSTTIKLLVPIEIGNKLFVKAAPSIAYFTGKHLAFGIVALLVAFFIS